jgi:hypothetical protein
LFRGLRVALLDRDAKRFVHRQRTGRAACDFRAEFEARAQDRRQGVLHLLHELVMAGGEDRAVKGEVGGHVFAVARDGSFHRLVSAPHGLAVIVRGALGGELGGVRLNDQAQLHQILDEAGVERSRSCAPGDHVRIEQLPLRARQHDRAVAAAHFEHAFGRERFHRLADRDAADLHLFSENGFGGQNLAWREFAGADLLAHLVQNLPVQGCHRFISLGHTYDVER